MVTSIVPAAWAGAVAVICVAEVTMNDVAAVPPKDTMVAALRFVRLMVTVCPPLVKPLAGLMPVTVGAGTTKVNWSAAEADDDPPALVTVTSMVAALCAGAVAVTWVSEVTVKDVAAVPPKDTCVAP